MATDDEAEAQAGYRKPPRSTRFQKGRSGNPQGRPKGRTRQPPFEALLGKSVTIRDHGEEQQVTAAEAFLLHLTKRGLQGDAVAARATLQAIEQAREARLLQRPEPLTLVTRMVTPGSVSTAIESLRIARRKNPYNRETSRNLLEPWIVEAALRRLPHPLTPDEQQIIVAVTRTPHKVKWPDWWIIRP